MKKHKHFSEPLWVGFMLRDQFALNVEYKFLCYLMKAFLSVDDDGQPRENLRVGLSICDEET